MYHWIALAAQTFGAAVVVVGLVRVVRAPVLAARRSATPAQGSVDGARYTRGLTDFYRISGALAVLAGGLLLLVTLFAS